MTCATQGPSEWVTGHARISLGLPCPRRPRKRRALHIGPSAVAPSRTRHGKNRVLFVRCPSSARIGHASRQVQGGVHFGVVPDCPSAGAPVMPPKMPPQVVSPPVSLCCLLHSCLEGVAKQSSFQWSSLEMAALCLCAVLPLIRAGGADHLDSVQY